VPNRKPSCCGRTFRNLGCVLRRQRPDHPPRTWRRSMQHKILNVLITIIPLPRPLPVKQKVGSHHTLGTRPLPRCHNSRPRHTASLSLPETESLRLAEVPSAVIATGQRRGMKQSEPVGSTQPGFLNVFGLNFNPVGILLHPGGDFWALLLQRRPAPGTNTSG
jgi:hypothetical protein